MLKNSLFLLLFLFAGVCFAQTGSVAGKLIDKEYDNEPLAFANVYIKGTEKGTTSDIDGLFEIKGLEPGDYTLVTSYVGYETQEIPITIVADKVTNVEVPMGASAAGLDEIVIQTTTRKNSEAALLLDQKNSVEIKESIGAEQLATLGVANASAATTKIAGVSKSDGAGQIYVRGLGDRYLTTTINGLPVPSDNIDKKNIDLELIPASFIENVSISKTFSPYQSADQASGNINIATNAISSRRTFGLTIGSGVNSNAASVFNEFKATAVNDQVNFGIFSRPYTNDNLQDALLGQSWSTQDISAPIDYSFGFNAGGFLDEEGKFRLYFSGGQSVNHEYREGLFREFDQGQRNDSIPDGDNRFWRRTVSTSGLLTGQYRINESNRLTFNAMAINKVFQQVYEAGRDGNAIIFEELTPEEAGNQFVRDQNLKNTLLSVTQLLGDHDLSDNNELTWAVGYNRLAADEPNRIRNEINIMNANPDQNIPAGELQLGNTGGYQQSKRSQEILDNEFAGQIKDNWTIQDFEEGGDRSIRVSFGGDGRYKQREFNSIVQGFDDNSGGNLNPSSLDNLGEVFTQQNVDNGLLIFASPIRDTYDASLQSYAAFADFVGVFGRFTTEVGVRFQSDEIEVDYDVNNAPGGRTGVANKAYERIYPAVNLKYDINDNSAVRLSGSLSQTLPEFKEIAPFEYVSQLNQITAGNRFIEASRNLNVDLKYEVFPSRDELISVAAFYKRINDPINKSLRLGGEDIFSYFNTSDRARVLGLEMEGRIYLIKKSDSLPTLKLSGNVSYINHTQDLKNAESGTGVNGQPRTFRYRGISEIGLQGASDWTTNLALTYNTNSEHPYEFTLAANYASDRIFALGAPRNQNQPDVFYNGEIIEKGVVVLDFVLNKEINDNLSIGAAVKNILNPVIERYQLVSSDPGNSSAFDERTVLTYNRGVNANLTVNYKF